MLITRKIGSLVRGKATPFQIVAACVLGALLGFAPAFAQAPALVLLWALALLVLNANLFLAGVVGLLCKLLLLVGMPLWFYLGRALLDGPLQGVFRWMVNAPVLAYSGMDYYVVAGGQLAAVLIGTGVGLALVKSLQGYRRKMSKVSADSERYQTWKSKRWVKILTFIFLGSGRGKVSYEELLSKRVGNPIRIWGAAVALALMIALGAGVKWLAGPIVREVARGELEKANGATVDLEEVVLELDKGNFEIVGLAMTDPENVDTNIFQAKRITADVSATDLLRKRVAIDHLVVADASTGSQRSRPGVLLDGGRKKAEGVALPDYNDLEGVLENAPVWKERLSQVKRWLERLSSGGEEESLKERLAKEIRDRGYSSVKAEHLTEGEPAFVLSKFEALGVINPYLDGATIDILGNQLSSHPRLLEGSPSITLDSSDDRLAVKMTLDPAGLANRFEAGFKKVNVDGFAAQLKSDGKPPLSGGTMDLKIGGVVGLLDSDMVLKAEFADSKMRVAGEEVSLDGVTLPLAIRGPIDSPSVKLESDFLKNVAVSTAKRKFLEEVGDRVDFKGLLGGGSKDEPESSDSQDSEEESSGEESLEDKAKSKLKKLFE